MQIKRATLIEQIADETKVWDFVIVGGGATGLGIAVDAASRGFKTLLLEQSDFAKGTSSRSTKLVHGGVRYLAQGNIGLVVEALRERGILLKNAPHLVRNENFIIPNYSWWSGIFYSIGLSVYDLLAGKRSFGKSRLISRNELVRRIPNIKQDGLKSGVLYHDGQFDDARLAVALALTGIDQHATLLNYFKVYGLKKEGNKITGVFTKDVETGIEYSLKAKTVVNATGVFVDELLNMDEPEARKIVQPSQGIHLVFDKSFIGPHDALMIPKTKDGRVLFAIPWHDRTLIGTTDTPLDAHQLEPVALEEEIRFILDTTAVYLTKIPNRKDVLSVFAGLRPLAAPQEDQQKTKEISRSHKLIVSPSGLITITGGKWTTYRRMAEDTVDMAIKTANLPYKKSITQTLSLHGSRDSVEWTDSFFVYGSDALEVKALVKENAEWKETLDSRLPYIGAEVIWATRFEMARTIEDVLARRTRALFLDARAAIAMAPKVAGLMAKELNRNEDWEKEQVISFLSVAKNYILS
ncbi:MAG TPA: glycerol-3-phosphate dehydrogenase/oxidase [Puia sp.]|jgi:glycerol-3-phosphate dehydrogenase|nr:glycerol-3-phosphate dehydrogenase/oxidase [Puia sp.]